MNLTLFKSLHAVVAVLLVGFFLAWLFFGHRTAGCREQANAAFLLVTGWTSVAAYVVILLYAIRKHAQRQGFSPEFRMEVPIENVEKAQARLNEVRAQIAAGQLPQKSQVRKAVRRVLREAGVARVLRARIVEVVGGEATIRIEIAWREPLGRLAKWMHAHLYYGGAAAVLVWLHGGGHFGSVMGILLNGLSFVVTLTGLLGIGLWTVGPSWLSRREKDISIEKCFALRKHFGRKVEEVSRELEKALVATGDNAASGASILGRIERAARAGAPLAPLARSLLGALPAELVEHRSSVQDFLVLLGQFREVESEWRSLARIHFYLSAWRVVHVPATVLLITAVVIHVLSVAWY